MTLGKLKELVDKLHEEHGPNLRVVMSFSHRQYREVQTLRKAVELRPGRKPGRDRHRYQIPGPSTWAFYDEGDRPVAIIESFDG